MVESGDEIVGQNEGFLNWVLVWIARYVKSSETSRDRTRTLINEAESII
jgi:hypothetical protein